MRAIFVLILLSFDATLSFFLVSRTRSQLLPSLCSDIICNSDFRTADPASSSGRALSARSSGNVNINNCDIIGTKQTGRILSRSTGYKENVLKQLFLSNLKRLDNGLPSAKSQLFTSSLFDGCAEESTLAPEDPRPEVQLIQRAAQLVVNVPVEMVIQNRLFFGNFIGWKKHSPTIEVRLSNGSRTTIDVGQIVSVWDELDEVVPPNSPEDWAQVARNAIDLLGEIPVRKCNLDDFWKRLGCRDRRLPVDSKDLGCYLFQEAKFNRWINPRLSAEAASVEMLSTAELYAAALVLHYDFVHFRRRPSTLAEACAAPSGLVTGDENDNLCLREGGYVPLTDNVVLQREVDLFLKYYEAMNISLSAEESNNNEIGNIVSEVDNTTVTAGHTSDSSVEGLSDVINNSSASSNLSSIVTKSRKQMLPTPPCQEHIVLTQKRALELFAFCPSSSSAPPSVRQLLTRLHYDVTPDGAQRLLLVLNAKLGLSNATGYRLKRDLVAQLFESGRRVLPNVIPWSAEVLVAVDALIEEMKQKRFEAEMADLSVNGKRSVLGNMDYRANSSSHPVICVDTQSTNFVDDGFSLDSKTGEVLVHITDVREFLRRHPVLQGAAKERISSTFFPSGVSHMLPPRALEALKLCSDCPNEVVTVALKIDPDTGELLRSRIFPAMIGPVFCLTTERADELLDKYSDSIEEDAEFADVQFRQDLKSFVRKKKNYDCDENELSDAVKAYNAHSMQREEQEKAGGMPSPEIMKEIVYKEYPNRYSTKRVKESWWLPGQDLPPPQKRGLVLSSLPRKRRFRFDELDVPDVVIRDLLEINRLVTLMVTRYPWMDQGQGSTRKYALNRHTDMYQSFALPKTPASRLVHGLLSAFANSTCSLCINRKIPIPIPWECRDRNDWNRVRRFGSQPLRKWISLIQQRQIRAALGLELPLTKKECAEAVLHHNKYRKELVAVESLGRGVSGYASLEKAVAGRSSDSTSSVAIGDQIAEGGARNSEAAARELTVTAVGTGRGGTVLLPEYGVMGTIVNGELRSGQTQRAVVKKLLPGIQRVLLEIVT